MTIMPWIALAVLASASTPEASQPPADTGTTAPATTPAAAPDNSDVLDLGLDPNWKPATQDVSRFHVQNQMKMADAGVLPPAVNLKSGVPVINPEAVRAAAYDKQFCPAQGGCYKAAKEFKDSCDPGKGCTTHERLAAGQLLVGGNDFATLENEFPDKASQAYQDRHQKIKKEMGVVVRELRPKPGAPSSYEAQFIKVADPVVTQVFTKEERAQFAQAVAGASGSAPAQTYLGNTMNDLGAPGPALQAFNAALGKDPASQEALAGRALANFNLGDFPAAARDAGAALALNPNDARAFATLKLSENRAPAANKGLAAAAAGGGATPAGVGAPGAGPSLHAAGPGAGADAETSRRAEAIVAEARRSLSLKDPARAAALLDRALAADPNNAGAYLLRAMTLARQGDYRAALRDAEAGLKLRSKDASLLVAKAFALNRLRDYSAALEAARQAREIDPNSADALAAYAHAAGGLGRREEMLSLLEEAARKDPRYASSLASARSMPAGSDLLFLFPGESMPGGASAQETGPRALRPASRTRRFGVLAAASVVGGLLVAMLLLQGAAGPLTRRIKTVFTGAPMTADASPDGRQGGGADAPPQTGLLKGQYRFVRQIGSGGMGLVYEGTDVTLNRPVAIKKMRDELRLDPRERERFMAEAQTVAALHHPNIVEIYGIIEEGQDVFLVFEYVSGQTVYDILGNRKTLSFPETLGIARGMAAALDFAHGHGVIHRDLKPTNVMINKEGFIKVMDFGIARMAKDVVTRVSMTNTIIGTPPYMAPEQEQGVIRKEVDVYALAACVYEMLRGQPAFQGSAMLMNKIEMAYVPVTKGTAGLPAGIDEVFAHAFQANPEKRFHTSGEFLKALGALTV